LNSPVGHCLFQLLLPDFENPVIGAKPKPAFVVGNLAHRFLQEWHFGTDTKNFTIELKASIDQGLPQEFQADRAQIEAELNDIFQNFFPSKAYAEIAGASILGREVPLLMPWDGQIMEGVIDLIYERSGLLYLADYKTDRIAKSELPQGAENYRRQAEIYAAAASQSLRRPVAAFKLVFLRAGEAVEIAPKANFQLSLFS
jgi:ATP-dependent helicase/nuclease subunit A